MKSGFRIYLEVFRVFPDIAFYIYRLRKFLERTFLDCLQVIMLDFQDIGDVPKIMPQFFPSFLEYLPDQSSSCPHRILIIITYEYCEGKTAD